MAHDKHPHHDERRDLSHVSNEDVMHEKEDVRIRPIALFIVWLTVATIVVSFLMAGLYKVLEAREEKNKGEQSPMAAERNVIPPEPRLQLAPEEPNQRSPRFIEDHPLMDMKKLREEEHQRLNESGPVDPNTGVAKIPIEDAKHLLLSSGMLKSRPPATEPQGQPQHQGATDGHGSPTEHDAGHTAGAAQAGQSQTAVGDQRPSRASSGRRAYGQQAGN